MIRPDWTRPDMDACEEIWCENPSEIHSTLCVLHGGPQDYEQHHDRIWQPFNWCLYCPDK